MEPVDRWHYAVHKGHWYYDPACASTPPELVSDPPMNHGITINRGLVNCPNCKRMMGMV